MKFKKFFFICLFYKVYFAFFHFKFCSHLFHLFLHSFLLILQVSNAIMIFFILSFKICVASATLDKILFALSGYVQLDVLLKKLTFTMRTSQLCFITVHQVISYFISFEFKFAIHTIDFCEWAFFLNVTNDHFSF